MTSSKKKTKSTYSVDLEFAIEKCSNLGSTTRAMLQQLQGDFNPNSTQAYFVFFQKIYTDKGYFSKYASPKRLSISKRSDKVFKFTKLYKCLSLRYTCTQCSSCKEFFSLFNTSKHYKSWETESMPTISRKLWEIKRTILCTDCIWVLHNEDNEDAENE